MVNHLCEFQTLELGSFLKRSNKVSMTLLAGQILAIIWIVLNSLIFAPYASYQTYLYYKCKRESLFIFNRKPDMVLSFSISMIITVSIVMPICYGWEIFSNKELNTEHYGYIIILYALAATIIIGVWRIWHVWFDTKYKMEAARNTWAKHLDNREIDLFTRYKSTFGNSKWTKKYLIIIAIILTCIFIIIIWQKAFVVIEGIVCFTIFIAFVCGLILIKRLSQVKDEIMLRLELVYFASFGTLFGIVFFVLFIASHDWNEADPNDIEVLYDALYLIIPSPILYLLILTQTQWVMYQYKTKYLNQKNRQNQNSDIIDSKSNKNGTTTGNDIAVSLKDIMSDFEGYKVFMG